MKQWKEIVRMAKGLSESELENAFQLAVVSKGDAEKLAPEDLHEFKKRYIKSSPCLSFVESHGGFDSLGGFNFLKKFALRSFAGVSENLFPKGVLLFGVPGSGKSLFGKCLGTETKLATVQLTMGKVLGSYVGDSEKAMLKAFETLDEASPCLLLLDEMEKILSGSGNGRSDGGTMWRLLSSLLEWLNDENRKVFVVATCNHIENLPPELTRAARFDLMTFVDFPTRVQKDEIWKICRKKYQLDDLLRRPNDDQWTGAEIAHCCYLASLQKCTLKQAGKLIVPVSRVYTEQIQKARQFASGKLLDAHTGKIYNAQQY
jgi:hypothetical protein